MSLSIPSFAWVGEGLWEILLTADIPYEDLGRKAAISTLINQLIS